MARRTTKRRTTKRRTTTTKTKKRTSTSRKKTGEMLIVGSKAKAQLKKLKCNTAGDALGGLNTWIYWLLDQAAKRAKANGRKTVRAHDFIGH